jgi:hypothetical protein
MGLPDDWQVYAKDLVSRKIDGKDAVRSAVDELMSTGYMTRHRVNNKEGHIEWDYTIYEKPPERGKTKVGFSEVGEPAPTKEPIRTKEPEENKYKNTRPQPVAVPSGSDATALEASESGSTGLVAPGVGSPAIGQARPFPAGVGAKATVKKPGRSWVRGVQAIYHKAYGGYLQWGFKALDPIVADHGADEMMRAFEAFVAGNKEQQYATLNYFARTYQQWAEKAQAPDRYNDPARYAKVERQ